MNIHNPFCSKYKQSMITKKASPPQKKGRKDRGTTLVRNHAQMQNSLWLLPTQTSLSHFKRL
jgi:hypothetical protein